MCWITGTCHLRWAACATFSREPADPDRTGPPTNLSVYFALLAQVTGVGGLRTATWPLRKATRGGLARASGAHPEVPLGTMMQVHMADGGTLLSALLDREAQGPVDFLSPSLCASPCRFITASEENRHQPCSVWSRGQLLIHFTLLCWL